MGKKISAVIFGLMTLLAVAGCGKQNEEMAAACKKEYAELVDEHNVVVSLYADSEAEGYEGQLNGLGSRVKEIGELDVAKLESEELAALVEEMEFLMAEYEEIYHSLSGMQKEEKTTEYCQVSVTLKNMTTLPLYKIYFYNTAEEGEHTNYAMEDPEEHDGLETYNFVNLVMEKGQTVWHVEAEDEEGNTIESADIDLAPYNGKSAVIDMMFSFDTNEGWLEIR